MSIENKTPSVKLFIKCVADGGEILGENKL